MRLWILHSLLILTKENVSLLNWEADSQSFWIASFVKQRRFKQQVLLQITKIIISILIQRMKKISNAGIKNSHLKKIQRQAEGSLRSSSKKLKINHEHELPSIIMPAPANADKIRKKSIRLRQNLNVSNSQSNKKFKQNGLSSIRSKLQLITKRPHNLISKYSKNESLYMNAEIKPSHRLNILNPTLISQQNKNIYHDSLQYDHMRSKEKIEKKKRSESVKENKEALYHNIKILFNHIQNRLKTRKNKTIEFKHSQYCPTHNFTQLFTFSQIITTPGPTKSLASSPRFQLFETNGKKSHLSGTMMANLAQQIQRLQSLQIKNQDSLKMLMKEQIGLLSLELYQGRTKETVKQ